MKAIILAAGRGSRMGSLTDDMPKCRTILHGKELVEWQKSAFLTAGIKDIAIIRGYLAETFTFDVIYFDNMRWSQTNMVSSLLTASDWLKNDSCISSYSDIVFSTSAVAKLIDAAGDIVITYDPNWLKLWEARFEDPLSDAETFKLDGNKVIEIGKRTSNVAEIEGQYMGLVKYTPTGWAYILDYLSMFSNNEVDSLDMTSLLSGLIDHGITVNAVAIDDHWYEVDSENDLSAYSNMKSITL